MAVPVDLAIKDLNESRAEALHALLNTLAPGSSSDSSGKLSTEQVRKLSDKLGEILGDKAEADNGTQRNEKGELVNEEGLPIIDINEPIAAADIAFRPDPNSTFDDPDLLPLWTLSPEEKARRKAERERILDLLEQEETAQHARDAEETRRKLEEEMEKRKAAAQEEMEKLKKAKELQKKMGRALMKGFVADKEKAEKEKEKERADQLELDRLAAVAKPIKPRKSVTFAEEEPEIVGAEGKKDKGKAVDWGDVAPGTLRKAGGAANGFAERQTMKLNVVERHPACLRSPGPPPRDSDDESEPEAVEDHDSEDDEDLKDAFSRYRMNSPPPPPSDSEDEDSLPPDEEPSEWNDEDFDTARHQREVALEYYAKRKTIGAEVSSAMRAHTHDENDWDQPEVPLEASLASAPPKPPVSRFKADRISQPPPSTSGLASHSLGASVLSANSMPMKRAVRMGKLQDGKLVGGEEGDSEDEITADDENARQFLEMLRKGEVTNLGPLDTSVDPLTLNEPKPSADSADPLAKFNGADAAPPKPSKVSKFKMSLSQSDMTSGQTSPGLDSGGHTPILSASRSSPKLGFNSETSSAASSPSLSNAQRPQLISPGPSRVGGLAPRQMPSMVVESPSFVAPFSQGPPFQSVILDSPSFQPSPSDAVSPTPALVPSPTPTPTSTNAASSSPIANSPPAPSLLRASVIERRPPVVIPARGLQSTTESPGNTEPPRKVSRFKAQRS